MPASDVIVVGAGVIGAACAWHLAQAGARVKLLERTAPGAGASPAALGVLQFHARPGAAPAYQHLSRRSGQLYPALLDELAALTGERVPYHCRGQFNLALAEADLPGLEKLHTANAELGVRVERLTRADCLRLEPALTPAVIAGVCFPDDAWVDNTALTLALARAAQQAGVKLVRAEVEAIESAGDRVTGVRAGGQTYPAGWVVLAAGCWSGQIAGVPPLPVRPVRGQALAVDGQPVQRAVASARGYVVPTANGQMLVGATVEEAGFDARPTLGGVAEVAAIGLEIVPALAGCHWQRVWAGLRPGTPDELPYLGAFAERPNLIAATGHFRSGILQAPATAEIVCALINGAAPGVDLSALRPGRAVAPAG